jgi:hypothetical protein
MRTLGLEGAAGGKKRDSRNVANLVEPGGFPEGYCAAVTHPGLRNASKEPWGKWIGVMMGNPCLGADQCRSLPNLYEIGTAAARGAKKKDEG